MGKHQEKKKKNLVRVLKHPEETCMFCSMLHLYFRNLKKSGEKYIIWQT